jgi:hypothetical protein
MVKIIALNIMVKNNQLIYLKLKDKELDESLLVNGQNRFDFKANDKTTITFKLLTQGDEKNIDKELEGLKKLYGKMDYQKHQLN